MACELLEINGGGIDGEMTLASDAIDYVAGQPVRVKASGIDIAVDAFDVIGIMKNDKSVDASAKVGPMAGDTPDQSDLRASRCHGTLKVKMTRGKLLAGTFQTPFQYPPTGNAGAWAVNDKLFCSDAGLWDNVPENAGDQSYGTVTKAPTSATDSLEAVMTMLNIQTQSNA